MSMTIELNGGPWSGPRYAIALLLAAAIASFSTATSYADEAFDRGFTAHLAYDLGDKIALSVLVRSALTDRRADESDLKTVRHFGRIVERRAKRLGVVEIITRQWVETTSTPRVQMYAEGYQRIDAVGNALGARFGQSVQAAVELGFRVRVEIESVVHIPDDKREAIFAQQLRLAKAAGLDPSILTTFHEALRGTPTREQRLLASEKVYAAIREQFEKSIFEHPEIRRLRANVFEAANAVSLSILGRAYGADRAAVDKFFEQARIYGRNAKVVVSGIAIDGIAFPEPPALSDDHVSNLASAIHYLLQVVGDDTAQQLDELYGRHAAALLGLAIKVNLAMVLYAPSDSTGAALREGITGAGTDSWLPAALWQPLVAAMQEQKDQATVKQKAIDALGAISGYLETQRDKS